MAIYAMSERSIQESPLRATARATIAHALSVSAQMGGSGERQSWDAREHGSRPVVRMSAAVRTRPPPRRSVRRGSLASRAPGIGIRGVAAHRTGGAERAGVARDEPVPRPDPVVKWGRVPVPQGRAVRVLGENHPRAAPKRPAAARGRTAAPVPGSRMCSRGALVRLTDDSSLTT